MKKDAVKLKAILLFFAAGLVALTTASGYLYHQIKTYQFQNRRLIIFNDSILSENIELKNALLQKKSSAAFGIVPRDFKTKGKK